MKFPLFSFNKIETRYQNGIFSYTLRDLAFVVLLINLFCDGFEFITITFGYFGSQAICLHTHGAKKTKPE